jgi:hypothetical protein
MRGTILSNDNHSLVQNDAFPVRKGCVFFIAAPFQFNASMRKKSRNSSEFRLF